MNLNKIADTLTIDGHQINNPANNFPIATTNLAGLVSSALSVALSIVSVLMFVWLAWGIFQYIFAGGNKEALKKAQGRITWALVGFVITIMAYAISGFIQDIAKQNGQNAPTYIDSNSTLNFNKK